MAQKPEFIGICSIYLQNAILIFAILLQSQEQTSSLFECLCFIHCRKEVADMICEMI